MRYPNPTSERLRDIFLIVDRERHRFAEAMTTGDDGRRVALLRGVHQSLRELVNSLAWVESFVRRELTGAPRVLSDDEAKTCPHCGRNVERGG